MYTILRIVKLSFSDLEKRCVGIWESGCVGIWESGCVRICNKNVKKVSVFRLRYIRMGMWVKLVEVCEWLDGCEKFYFIFKCVKCKFRNLILPLKIDE